MKKLILVLGTLVAFSAYGKESKEVEADLKQVTVYLSGAELSHETAVSLKPGMTDIVFRNVAPNVMQSSIQASGKGAFIIMDVKYQTDYEMIEPEKMVDHREKTAWMKRINQINDTLIWLSFETKDFNYQKEALNGEKNLILQNELVKGKVDSFPILEQLTGFYRARIKDINKQLFEIEKREYYNSLRKSQLNKELQELQRLSNSNPNTSPTKRVDKIIVSVNTETYVKGNLNIKYMVANAGWTPQYDIRVANEDQSVDMVYKAKIFQNTGMNWDGVKLTLASSNPNQQFHKPNLVTLFVDFYQEYIQNLNSGYARNARPTPATNVIKESAEKKDTYEIYEGDVVEDEVDANYINSITQVVQSALHVEYQIPLNYDIPSDGQQHLVYVQQNKLSAEFEHYAVPKASCFVYLMANINGFKDLQLLPGPSNIYFDGTFVGQSSINPDAFNDTLNVSLGIDKMIAIKRKLVEKDTKDNVAMSKTTKYFYYEISIKNNKQKEIDLKILDQIPLSRQKEIEVELLEAKKAALNKSTGILTWNKKIKAKEEVKIDLKYSIKFPKDKQLSPIT